MNMFHQEYFKNVIEEPVIASVILTHLIRQNDWLSIINMQSVFKNGFNDVMNSDFIRIELLTFKTLNRSNKHKYYKNHLIDFINAHAQQCFEVGQATRFQPMNLQRKIEIHDTLFDYLVYHVAYLYTMGDACNSHLQLKLESHILNEPLYERQALNYLRILYPNSYYNMYWFVDIDSEYILDHEYSYDTDFYFDNECT